MDDFRLLGWKVRKLRREQRLTQEALVGKSGVANARAISDMERSKGNPTLQSIIDVAYGLGVPVTELFSAENAPRDIVHAPSRATKAIEALTIATDETKPW